MNAVLQFDAVGNASELSGYATVPSAAPVTYLEPCVLFRMVNRVAIVTLNLPATMNGVSHDVVRELAVWIERCRTDRNIVAVVVRGAGETESYGGEDARAPYRMGKRGDRAWLDYLVDEYRLLYSLYTFPKPIVTLLDGICMGGGLAIGQSARLRIATERTQVVMPERRIGFVRDSGATRFLSLMPVEAELYVGLVGVTLSGSDALGCQLADLCVPSQWLATFEQRLQCMPTHDISGEKLLIALRSVFEPPCNIVPHAGIGEFSQFIIRHFDRRSSIDRVISSLSGALDREPPREIRRWLQLTLESLVGQSPTMLCVTREALLRGRQMTVAECFKMELGIVARAIDDEEFYDDQRAQLVDTDRTRRWSPEVRVEVRPERVRHFLSPPWRKHSHPLASLGNEPNAW